MPGTVRPVTDERDALMAFLDQQRDLLKLSAYGLDEEQARRPSTLSPLTIGGLIKHVTFVERNWADLIAQRPRVADEASYGDEFVMADDETLADVIAQLDAAAAATSALIDAVDDLGRPVPVPDEPWFPADVDSWSVRWVLLHLIEEVARHAGHADIVREHLDGATAYPLMAAAEGWPTSPWMQPWEPELAV